MQWCCDRVARLPPHFASRGDFVGGARGGVVYLLRLICVAGQEQEDCQLDESWRGHRSGSSLR